MSLEERVSKLEKEVAELPAKYKELVISLAEKLNLEIDKQITLMKSEAKLGLATIAAEYQTSNVIMEALRKLVRGTAHQKLASLMMALSVADPSGRTRDEAFSAAKPLLIKEIAKLLEEIREEDRDEFPPGTRVTGNPKVE